MSITLNIPFTDPTDYTFDTGLIEIVAGKIQLKLQDNPGQNFIEDFADDTDFTYDSDKAEFVGGVVRQKSQNPANSLLYARWETDEDADYAYNDPSGTLGGTASVSGGKLSCVGEVVAYLDYSNISQGDGNKGTAKFKWIPKYSGAPATEKHIFFNGAIASYIGAVWLIQLGTNLYFYIYNSAGAVVLSKSIAFSPVADTTYEIAITWDYTGTDDSNVFINGVLKDGGNVSDTRGSTLVIRLGNDVSLTRKSDMEYDDFILYDSVMYTANYTPGYTLPSLYAANNVVLPEMEYTGTGTLISFDSFTTTETGSPRYTLQIGRSGDYLYWNGSAWVISNETYAQANDATTFNANLGDLNIEGEIYGQFQIHFDDSASQNNVDTLTASLTAQIYPTTNPVVTVNDSIILDALEGFTETSTKTGSDQIKYILSKDGTDYYHDGSSWTTSDGTYSQSNTASEVSTYKATFTTSGITKGIKILLHSDDGSSTPALDNLQVIYNFFAYGDTIEKCIVWGYFKDEYGQAFTDSFYVYLENDNIQYKNYTMLRRERQTVTPDSNGYAEIELVETENMEGTQKYVFDFGVNVERKSVPNEVSKNYYELT